MNELVLLLSEDAYEGDAQCTVSVDGVQVGNPVTVTALHGKATQPVTLELDLAPGIHTMAVTFINDAFGGPRGDRNLYFDGATLDGVLVPMRQVSLFGTGPCAPVMFTVPRPGFDFAGAFAMLETKLDAGFNAIMAGLKAGASPPAAAPPPGYTGPMLDVLPVGPGKLFAEIADAIPHANPGALVLVDDGIYQAVFHCAVPGIRISSVSGNPFKCWCDGGGLSGGGKRGAYDKAFMHFGAPFIVTGIGGRNCGGLKSDRNHTNEAFIYAESFGTPGVARAVRCAADNCANGFFVPAMIYNGAPGPGANVHWEDEDCVMGSVAPNGQSAADGSASHDSYLSGLSVLSTNRIGLGCAGHSHKSRSPETTINGGYLCSLGGRAVEGPDGGIYKVTGATLVSRPEGNSNFIGWCDESVANGGLTADFVNCTFVVGRDPSTIHIGASATVICTLATVLYMGNAGLQVALGGTLTGVPQGQPDGAVRLASLPPPKLPTYVPA